MEMEKDWFLVDDSFKSHLARNTEFYIFQKTSVTSSKLRKVSLTSSLEVVARSEASSESEHQVKGRFLLDVVVGQGSAILKLLSGEDQPLLVWRDALLVLDLGLDVLDGVGWLNVQGDGLSSEGLDEDLHATSKSEDQMESRLLLDVVVRESSAVLKLLSGKDQPLLIWRDALFVLNLGLHVFDGVSWLDIQGDGLTGESLDENLHGESLVDLKIYKLVSILPFKPNRNTNSHI